MILSLLARLLLLADHCWPGMIQSFPRTKVVCICSGETRNIDMGFHWHKIHLNQCQCYEDQNFLVFLYFLKLILHHFSQRTLRWFCCCPQRAIDDKIIERQVLCQHLLQRLSYLFCLSIIRNPNDLNTFLPRVMSISAALSLQFNQLLMHGVVYCFRNSLLRFHSLQLFTDLS